MLPVFNAASSLRAEIVYTGNDPFAIARDGKADLVISHYGQSAPSVRRLRVDVVHNRQPSGVFAGTGRPRQERDATSMSTGVSMCQDKSQGTILTTPSAKNLRFVDRVFDE